MNSLQFHNVVTGRKEGFHGLTIVSVDYSVILLSCPLDRISLTEREERGTERHQAITSNAMWLGSRHFSSDIQRHCGVLHSSAYNASSALYWFTRLQKLTFQNVNCYVRADHDFTQLGVKVFSTKSDQASSKNEAAYTCLAPLNRFRTFNGSPPGCSTRECLVFLPGGGGSLWEMLFWLDGWWYLGRKMIGWSVQVASQRHNRIIWKL